MNDNSDVKTPRGLALRQMTVARQNLLLMIGLTAVNLVLFFTGSETMMLFSATVPYYAVAFGFYTEDSTFTAVGIAVAVVILLLYLLCWALSKKNYAWMAVALTLFIIDSIALIALYIWTEDFSGILDAAIHAWVLYYLIIGVKFGRQLKNLPEEEEAQAMAEDSTADTVSRPLRRADQDVKFRVLVEGDCGTHRVCFRRVKRTNELVIDGYVYAEAEMLIEPPHELSATVDGDVIVVGYNGSYCYIKLNGEQTAKKLRLI